MLYPNPGNQRRIVKKNRLFIQPMAIVTCLFTLVISKDRIINLKNKENIEITPNPNYPHSD